MKFDKQIRCLSERIKTNSHTLKFQLRALYDLSNKAKHWIKCQKRSYMKQRNNFLYGAIKGLIFSLLLFFFRNTKLKKKILLVDMAFVIYDIFKAGCKL
ncbi:hypothetical protein IJG72_07490 [bacterium]|nr:hypothetical protein [bacterium]